MYHLFFLFCISFFLNVSQVSAKSHSTPKQKSPTGYVVSDDPSWGRLGNQLFVVATVLSYAWDHDFKPLFPSFNRQDNQLSYNRDRIFFRLDTRDIPLKIHKRYAYPSLVFKPIPVYKNTRNVSLQGQFVNWQYFHHHREKLLAMFEPSPTIVDYLHSKYVALIDNPKTVAVHVRTFSKQIHENGCPFVGLKYFELAFEHYPVDSIFVVFADRINWCKVNFARSFPGKTFVFIEGNDHVEDLYLMSLMKHQILSNSTYSWWGAYLNKNPHKIISCPQQLFANPTVWPIEDTFLPDWRIIPHDFTQVPYPADMGDYDEKTFDDNLPPK